MLRPLVVLEDGKGSAAHMDTLLAGDDALSIFLSQRLLDDDNKRRLVRFFGAGGWLGKVLHSFYSFVDNVRSRTAGQVTGELKP